MNISPAVATIIGALVGALASIIVAVVNSNSQHKKFLGELDKQTALIVYRLEQLENKVAAHNNFDRRLVALEEQVKTLFNSVNGG